MTWMDGWMDGWMHIPHMCFSVRACLLLFPIVALQVDWDSIACKVFRGDTDVFICLVVSPHCCLSVYQSICVSVCLAIGLSIYLSVCLSTYLCTYLSSYLAVTAVCLSVYPSIRLSIYLFISSLPPATRMSSDPRVWTCTSSVCMLHVC